ncbi:DMT family protein [Heliorestis acidaminivorans]|uniref:DMT family protein n=1 Tax=Heliorestis acidaminivorans TaxID=553427 RepID=A0A6I0EXA9_9FIRM|nr:hypothetical protein [Heliorestis acidaminivorans]KAB2951181.1 DMT family protein [Heliorestis acidaminivorans]
MGQILLLLLLGSLFIALVVTLQTKYIDPNWLDVGKYNLYTFPVMFIANTLLFIAFTKGQAIFGSLAVVVGIQIAIYMLSIALFSYLMLGQQLSWNTALGIALLVLAVFFLNRG